MKPLGGYLSPLRGFFILEIKVIGPITEQQYMSCACAKTSAELQKACNRFLEKIKRDGAYFKLVRRYNPKVFSYCREFFEENNGGHSGDLKKIEGQEREPANEGGVIRPPGPGSFPAEEYQT